MKQQPKARIDVPTLPTVWHVPPELLRRSDVGAEAVMAAIVLWQFAGCRPGKVELYYAEFALLFGRKERSARRWIERLAKAGIVEVLNEFTAGVEIRIRQPRPRQSDRPAARTRRRPTKTVEQLCFPYVIEAEIEANIIQMHTGGLDASAAARQ